MPSRGCPVYVFSGSSAYRGNALGCSIVDASEVLDCINRKLMIIIPRHIKAYHITNDDGYQLFEHEVGHL